MSVAELVRSASPSDAAVEHFDVLVVGAGISGVGAAYHMQKQTPWASYVVLEAMESFGGTWWQHKYPGVRSDSDLYTFGYRFKPWTSAPIASGEEILKYMREVIEENDLGSHIRYRHKITSAVWSTEAKQWTVEGVRGEGEPFRITANFLWMCQGYYRHAQGYLPDWPGMETFGGRIVHAQTWPEDLDVTGKKVVVIGSGATAATVAPAVAGHCEHVTVLQRSPTYFYPGKNEDDLANQLRELEIDETWIHEIIRKKRLHEQQLMTKRCIEEPEAVQAELLAGVKAFLGEDYDVATHFTPRYRVWQQRLAFIPDGDLFRGIASGKASMVTDHIERFTETGILLKSGQTLEADVVVAATGFDLSILGDIDFTIDGRPLNFADSVTYRGMMFTGVPNLVWIFGYFRASWTLRVDLVADFVARLLQHMRDTGARQVEVALRPEDEGMALGPWLDPEDFNPNYIQRSLHLMPKSGAKPEWRHNQDYWTEKDELPKIDLNDPAFRYS